MGRAVKNFTVYATDPQGREVEFGPGDVLPQWAEDLVTFDVTEEVDDPAPKTEEPKAEEPKTEEPMDVEKMSIDELREEHNRLTGSYPHHAMGEATLRTRVTEARAAQGGSGG